MAEAGEGTNIETGAPPKKPDEPKFGPVSYERFSEVNGAKRALSKEVEALRPKAAEADTLRARVAELEGQQAGWQEERAILGSGVLDDPDEAIDLARTFHRKLPEADRPALADWIKGLAADGATVPKALQPYIRKPAAAVTTPPPKVAPPKVDSTGKAPPTASAVDPAQLAAARKEFQRTGNRAPYEAVLNAVKGAGKKA